PRCSSRPVTTRPSGWEAGGPKRSSPSVPRWRRPTRNRGGRSRRRRCWTYRPVRTSSVRPRPAASSSTNSAPTRSPRP
ncbi:hypothetical protein, partial [Rhodococcus sp. CX]|uniref:hypothetical protein n=1 Tax=Rhodococcus sp. CX TaxID=2789880 RepID=UPI0035A88ECC